MKIKIKINKYRIIRDDFLGYEAQHWRLWFPLWIPMGCITNTHRTVEAAEKYIHKCSKKVVKYVDIPKF